MKEKIVLFIIGVLVGTIVSTGAFYIYTTTNSSNTNQAGERPGGNPPSMPDRQNNENGQSRQEPDAKAQDDTERNNRSSNK